MQAGTNHANTPLARQCTPVFDHEFIMQHRVAVLYASIVQLTESVGNEYICIAMHAHFVVISISIKC